MTGCPMASQSRFFTRFMLIWTSAAHFCLVLSQMNGTLQYVDLPFLPMCLECNGPLQKLNHIDLLLYLKFKPFLLSPLSLLNLGYFLTSSLVISALPSLTTLTPLLFLESTQSLFSGS